MSNSKPITMVFNLAGASAALVVGIYALQSLTASKELPSCTKRYDSRTQITLTGEKGGPMSPIELQAMIGREEWGVLENVSVTRVKAGRGAEALRRSTDVLEIKMPAGTSSAFQVRAPRGGAGFIWAPDSMQDATSACLSYKVMLPKDFDFGDAGFLPGLYGGDRIEPGSPDGNNGFATRFVWGKGGVGGIAPIASTGGGLDGRRDDAHFTFERGRWVELVSELVLNTPGSSDGALRLWVDGELKLDRNDVAWRADESVKISGVTADISYGSNTTAPADAALQITPFELGWK